MHAVFLPLCLMDVYVTYLLLMISHALLGCFLFLKIDVTSVFIRFRKNIENHLYSTTKAVQMDGGGEFVNNTLILFLQNNGITHRLNCPHTAEQNGLVEQKHHHLVSMGQCLRYKANIPQQYRVDAFNTACFIINQTSTPVLNDSCPFEILFNKAPDLSLLWVLGCCYYPLLTPYAKNKLEPRSMSFVFMGYDSHRKGYRCLHLSTGQIYVSCHVIFDEETFPFSLTNRTHKNLESHSLFFSSTHSYYATCPIISSHS